MRSYFLQAVEHSVVRAFVVVLFVFAALPSQLAAQRVNAPASPVSSAASSVVPQIIQFNGQLDNQPSGISGSSSAAVPSGTVSITFTLYENEQGGTALWSETDNVQVNAQGNYTALLGSASPDGLPMDLFTTGQAHWLAVQPLLPGFAEQPRVLLVSAPYALKAGDAETIGGLPPSAFVLAAPGVSPGSSAGTSASSTLAGLASPAVPAEKPAKPSVTGSGTTDYIPIWTSSSALGNSIIYQTGGDVGVGTTTPGYSLDVNGSINTGAAYKIGGSTVLAQPGGSSAMNTALGYSALVKNTSGTANTASGDGALGSNTKGGSNTATGYQALYNNTTGGANTASGANALYANATGNNNVATGYQALYNNTASGNTATGANALYANTTGNSNVATGYEALYRNTTGSFNLASGYGALAANTTGSNNTASGYAALTSNTTGGSNVASGYSALQNNTTGALNTAIGVGALENNTTADYNTALGNGALSSNTTGSANTASGLDALVSNTTGSTNLASGITALASNTTGSENTAIGAYALDANTTGSNNVAIGYMAATSVSGANGNNIEIGNAGSSTDSGVIRIGTKGTQASFFVAGVAGVSVGSAVPVMIDSATGQLGTVSSSRRFKEDIQDMGDASRDLMRLRPVTFRYKQPFADGSKPIQYGLIAEEVAEVYPDMVVHSADGQIETVKYQMLGPMLLNEVQRHDAELQDLQRDFDDMEAMLASMSRGRAAQ
jgi:hypothetical protein